MRKFSIRPGHPERICWGCEHLCPANDMRCGNGTERAQHPIELWGEDWESVGKDFEDHDPSDAPARMDDPLRGAATPR
ncbi:MAG: DUF3079 domain-containing protein [Proteobacteria bacterium]|nr:DUF3079 domain-containing protein [Pseudomonadota bacterium]